MKHRSNMLLLMSLSKFNNYYAQLSIFSNHEKWWLAIKIVRKALYKKIPHLDKNGNYFVFGEAKNKHFFLDPNLPI